MARKYGLSRKRAISAEKTLAQKVVTDMQSDVGDAIDADSRKPFLKEGKCQKGICGKEAACWPYPNNTYTCVCPHDKSPPTADWRCARITVPPTPHPIKNIRLSTEGNSTSNKSQKIESSKNATSSWAAATLGSIPTDINVTKLFIILTPVLIFTIAIYLLIRKCSKKSKRPPTENPPSPVQLKRSLLVPDRYAPNPQYSICTNDTVPIIKRDSLTFLNELGQGCFGKVYKGELRTDSLDKPEIVAIKVLKESATRETEEDFLQEVDTMSAFRHKNILSLLGVVSRESGLSPMMVFEYMPHGDLAEVLRSQEEHLADHNKVALPLGGKDVLSVAMQIACGMDYLAAQHFVHRDLACRNCLVADGPTIKIADFGMSRDVYTCDYYKMGGSRLLPVRWMAPESVAYGRFTLESDIWSFGVVLWEIYNYGKQPYFGHSNQEVVKLILQGIMLRPPNDCPILICELMFQCWKTDPRHRINFTDIFERLQKAYKTYEEDTICASVVVEAKPTFGTFKKDGRLPRPPPILPLTPKVDLLDPDGYLLPKEVKQPVEYLQTLPD